MMRDLLPRFILTFGLLTHLSLGWIAPPRDNFDVETLQEVSRLRDMVYKNSTLLEKDANEDSSSSISVGRKLRPDSGTHTVLVILTYFTDHAGRSRPPVSKYEELFVELKRWFHVNSFHQYEIEPVITEWYPSDNTEAHYAQGDGGFNDESPKAFWPALDHLNQKAGFDWSRFDSNGDGLLDLVVFLHSGYGAEMGQIHCSSSSNSNNGRAQAHGMSASNWRDRLWSRAYPTSRGDQGVWNNGQYTLDGYVIASAFGEECTTERAGMGIIAHEWVHTLDARVPDLYDTSESDSKGFGIGNMGVMSYAYGPKNNAMLPGHLSAWTKQELGWISPEQIWEDGVYTLRPAETSPDAFVIQDYFASFEYLLIENRQQMEYDVDQAGSGLVIYLVDERAPNMAGHPGQNGWPQNGNHYKVAVLQADGKYDLELGNNRGDADDFWAPGMTLGPGSGGTVFPNTDSYQGGDIFETGITIEVLEGACGKDVRFRVTGIWEAETPTPPPAPCPGMPSSSTDPETGDSSSTDPETGDSSSTAAETVDVSIEITLDGYSDETGWSLLDKTNQSVIRNVSPGDYPWYKYRLQTIKETITVVRGADYRFTITDNGDDGICCSFGDGAYAVTVDGTVHTGESGGSFGREEHIDFSP